MAKKKLEIEFAFGLASGTVLFVLASHLTEAIKVLATCPMADYCDRRAVSLSGVSCRAPDADAHAVVRRADLLWWTVLSGGMSKTFEACAYPECDWLPSIAWLKAKGLWIWGLAPGTTNAVPGFLLSAVLAAEASK